eukprot:gene14468-biopygen11582
MTALLLGEVCKDVRLEPALQPLTGEAFNSNVNISDEARSDISARGFWQTGQVAFFDIRVFNPTANRCCCQEISKSYEINEREKKRAYNDRVLEVEHGSFTPIVISATGGMGREAKKFYSRLAEMIGDKRKRDYSLVKAWLRRKISFALVKAINICIRGSRRIFKNIEHIRQIADVFDRKRSPGQ